MAGKASVAKGAGMEIKKVAETALESIAGPKSIAEHLSNPHYADIRILDKNVARGRKSLVQGNKRAGEGKTEMYTNNVVSRIKYINPSFVAPKTVDGIFKAGDEMMTILKNHADIDKATLREALSMQKGLASGNINSSQFATDLAKIKAKKKKK
jgi:hypothetical protein